MNMTPQQKAANTRAKNKYAAYLVAENAAKAEIIRRGYGPRFYNGKHHAIQGLAAGETYHQDADGGYDSWQLTLEHLA